MSFALFSCASIPSPVLAEYSEKYRPQFHFSPKSGWMGDPDGLVYHDGLYHIFWWGHAVSRDLVHWTELPWPMVGDEGGFKYYTGSVAVDKGNSAGFGANSLVAAYTMHREKDNVEQVGLSFSRDGVNFQYYKGNPVLDTKSTDFRDPQVFWYAPLERWTMVIALPGRRKVSFYSSKDLKQWRHESDWGQIGAQSTVWECPDLVQLPVDGNPDKKKWVLIISLGPNRVQYFPGSFDGSRFTLDKSTEEYLKTGDGLEGSVFASFDGNRYDDWTAAGTAFGGGPSQNADPAHIGSGQADSFGGADSATGTLTSPPFTIQRNAINFLIGGGRHPEQTCINLLVDGKVVRSTTGDNGGLKWNGWDVGDLNGKTATLQIVDNYTGGDYGHVNVDHILFADRVQNQNLEHALWADYGPDFYAARTWRGEKQRRTTWIGWLGNWEYANDLPSSWGNGFQSIPREISLKTEGSITRLVQTPLPELAKLRGPESTLPETEIPEGNKVLAGFAPSCNTYEMEAVFAPGTARNLGLHLLVGDGRRLTLGYDTHNQSLYLDRTKTSDFSKNANFNAKFPQRIHAPLKPIGGTIKLHIFVDQSSVEVFANDGRIVLSAVTYPGENQTGIELFAENGNASLTSFKAWELNSIWNSVSYQPHTLPKLVEAEDYNKGGEGVSYHDADLENQGNSYREDGVDIEPAEEDGHYVAFIADGEWLAYDVTTQFSGVYEVDARVAGNGGRFRIEVDGQDVSGPVTVPNTGGFRTWQNVTTAISLPPGEHTVRLNIEKGGFNLDSLLITAREGHIVNGGIYKLSARHSGRVLDVSGIEDGATLQQWEALGFDNQKWRVESAGHGFYKLIAVHTGKALTAGGTNNGATVQQQTWKNADNQKWTLNSLGGRTFSLISITNGKALEVKEFSKQNGGRVQLWEYLGGASQQWELELVR